MLSKLMLQGSFSKSLEVLLKQNIAMHALCAILTAQRGKKEIPWFVFVLASTRCDKDMLFLPLRTLFFSHNLHCMLHTIIPLHRLMFIFSFIGFSLGGAGLIAEKLGIPVCRLCLLERWICYGCGIVGALGFFWKALGESPWFWHTLVGLWATGALLCLYHVGIEHHWIALPKFCQVNLFPHLSSEGAVHAMLKNTSACDKVSWYVFGISAATWLGISMGCLAFFIHLMKKYYLYSKRVS